MPEGIAPRGTTLATILDGLVDRINDDPTILPYVEDDADLAALAALGSTGIAVRTAADTWAQRTLAAPAAGFTITNPAGVAGNPTFVLANDLSALEGLSVAGFAARTGSDAWSSRTLQAPAAGLTISNPAGTAGDPTFALANDLAAVEGLGGNGLAVRTGTDTWTVRAINGTAGYIEVTNGDGIAGAPTLALGASAEIKGNRDIAGGYCSLDGSGKVAVARFTSPSFSLNAAHPGFGVGNAVTVPTSVLFRRVVATVNLAATAGLEALVELMVETAVASGVYTKACSCRQAPTDILERRYTLTFDVPGGVRYYFTQTAGAGTTETNDTYGWTQW